MKSLYTIESVQRLINDYLSKGGELFQMRDGVLGLGDFILYDLSGKYKTFVVHQVALNERSSAQTVRAYNKMPEKYRSMIERG